MRLISRNNKSQQQRRSAITSGEKVIPVIITYPHRIDENGNPLVRVRFVRSTEQPNYRHISLFAWALRIRTELLCMRNEDFSFKDASKRFTTSSRNPLLSHLSKISNNEPRLF